MINNDVPPSSSSVPNRLVGYFALLLIVGACSKQKEKNDEQFRRTNQTRQDFILREVYSGKYCFRTRFYWRDSLRNIRDICRVQSHYYDSINHVSVDLHGWQGRDCDTNEFVVIRQGNKAWFVPFCDEMELASENHYDTTFFKTSLVITHPLNTAVMDLALKERPFFIAGLLNLLLPGRRLTRKNCETLIDPKTRTYLRLRLDDPKRYYYRVVRGGDNTLWEFDDTQASGLQVRVIRPTWYRCISM